MLLLGIYHWFVYDVPESC